jgi:8-oxo-dGTP pyrophosphatase MutT (NUDIX family)
MCGQEIAKKCASCFVIDDDKILLIYHKKFDKYIQPGGHIEGDEEPYQTAIREIFEETGVTIKIDDKSPFNIEIYDTKIGKQLDYQFIGIPVNKNAISNDESYLCGWFDINKLDNIDIVEDLKDKIKMIKSR